MHIFFFDIKIKSNIIQIIWNFEMLCNHFLFFAQLVFHEGHQFSDGVGCVVRGLNQSGVVAFHLAQSVGIKFSKLTDMSVSVFVFVFVTVPIERINGIGFCVKNMKQRKKSAKKKKNQKN